MENHISSVAHAARDARVPLQTRSSVLSLHMRNRVSEFDRQYEQLLNAGPHATVLALVSDFRADFEGIREYLLAFGNEHRFGPRWCPDIRKEGADPVKVAAGFREIVARSVDLHQRQPKELGLLATAAAQAAIGYVVELAELLGLRPRVTLGVTSESCFVTEGAVFLVGSNPFFVREPGSENLFHYARARRSHRVGWPLVGTAPPAPEQELRPSPLLDEDEWEMANLALYLRRHPRLVFDLGDGLASGEGITLAKVPPLYPWGFRLLDMQHYRLEGAGNVSKAWHLTATVVAGEQICKGGGMRDRGRRAFRLGSRGRLRIGEYDEFLEPAYCHEV